jgi:hypothetical protein
LTVFASVFDVYGFCRYPASPLPVKGRTPSTSLKPEESSTRTEGLRTLRLAEHLFPVHVGHRQIQQDEPYFFVDLAEQFDCLTAIFPFNDAVAVPLQGVPGSAADGFLVIHDEDGPAARKFSMRRLEVVQAWCGGKRWAQELERAALAWAATAMPKRRRPRALEVDFRRNGQRQRKRVARVVAKWCDIPESLLSGSHGKSKLRCLAPHAVTKLLPFD